MDRNHLPLLVVGRFFLLTQLFLIAGVVDAGAAFVNSGRTMVGSSRQFVPRSVRATHLAYGNEGSASPVGSPRISLPARGAKNGRRTKGKGQMNKSGPPNGTKNSKQKKINRPASFAAIRKQMRKDKTRTEEVDGARNRVVENVIDTATISRISIKRHRERQREQQAMRLAKIERKELKVRLYEFSIETERGFQSTPQQAKEVKEITDRLTELNPTKEPAWSYYGKTNPLTRQLYQSLASDKQKKKDEDDNNLASLEGKWILTYTNVPSIVALASDSNRWGFAKLGRIGQECTPFPDYTVRTIIEWKRPDWVQNLETNLPGPVSRRLFGKAESSVLQKTTLRARANPDDPTSWGVSTVPRVFEVVSSRSSSALYDDDDETIASSLSFVTDDGLLALDPLKPLKIGLQIAGMDDEQDLFADGDGKGGSQTQEAGGTSMVTKNGLVALNPFQPWTVGLQMAGFARRAKATEPWKIDNETIETNEREHEHNNSLFEDINERGLVEGLLKQTPIQLPTPDAIASMLGDDVDEGNEAHDRKNDSKSEAPCNQRILYLDDDIRIIGDGHNHVTIESRACTDDDEECWF